MQIPTGSSIPEPPPRDGEVEARVDDPMVQVGAKNGGQHLEVFLDPEHPRGPGEGRGPRSGHGGGETVDDLEVAADLERAERALGRGGVTGSGKGDYDVDAGAGIGHGERGLQSVGQSVVVAIRQRRRRALRWFRQIERLGRGKYRYGHDQRCSNRQNPPHASLPLTFTVTFIFFYYSRKSVILIQLDARCQLNRATRSATLTS